MRRSQPESHTKIRDYIRVAQLKSTPLGLDQVFAKRIVNTAGDL